MKIRISFSALAAALGLFAGIALADDSCKPLAEISNKPLTIPTHIYSTQTAAFTGGKPRNSEVIYLIDKAYVQVNGQWRVSPMSPKMLLEEKKNTKPDPDVHSTCRVLRDEVIDGEAATVYSEHTETRDEKIDSQIWISKSRGLPLKMENSMDVGGAAGKSHTVSRYEYTNVRAPEGVR